MLSGCCCRSMCRRAAYEKPYWRVVLTDFEGCYISEYIAEGKIAKMPDAEGYCIWAVQRRTFRPWILTYKYPLGRPVKVMGSNIIITPACKPLWLQETDRYLPPPNQCRSAAICYYRR